jgi:hypothetical protein
MEQANGDRYDLAIIGSGGAAFAAAIAARRKDRRVVMIERATIGGTCVNTGCVPSKALLAAADARQVAAEATGRFPGITTTAGPVESRSAVGRQAHAGRGTAGRQVRRAGRQLRLGHRARSGPLRRRPRRRRRSSAPGRPEQWRHPADPGCPLPGRHRLHALGAAHPGPGPGRLPHLDHGDGAGRAAGVAAGGRRQRPLAWSRRSCSPGSAPPSPWWNCSTGWRRWRSPRQAPPSPRCSPTRPVGARYSVTSCDLRILMDQPTDSIPPHHPPSRHHDR